MVVAVQVGSTTSDAVSRTLVGAHSASDVHLHGASMTCVDAHVVHTAHCLPDMCVGASVCVVAVVVVMVVRAAALEVVDTPASTDPVRLASAVEVPTNSHCHHGPNQPFSSCVGAKHSG